MLPQHILGLTLALDLRYPPTHGLRQSIDKEYDVASTEEKDRAKKGIKARQDAIRTLIANHQAEFDELHQKNRIALGLPLRAQGPTREQLEERVRKQRERLEKWEAELKLVS